MNRKRKSHQHKKQITIPSPGASPGVICIDERSLKPKINLYTYNADSYKVEALSNLNDIVAQIANKQFTYWVEVKGFKSTEMFDVLANDLKINKLVLEDITQNFQRAKFEEYEGFNFAISRMLYTHTDDGSVENQQISFILQDHVLFTFQDVYEDCLGAVRKRLAGGKGNIRIGGSSYLMYALMDNIVDDYFNILGDFAEQLDAIEDRLLDRPDKSIMYDTQKIKRNLITLRRAIWPERDKLNDIIRTENTYVSDDTKLYFKDAYDHSIQIIDMVESLKEIAAANIDMYLSIISNRMNEIMKVLTIISSIFIPLTFIAGIYGMNFAREDPETHHFMPDNMPELYAAHGYLYTLIVMLIIAALQVVYFWRKGWFK